MFLYFSHNNTRFLNLDCYFPSPASSPASDLQNHPAISQLSLTLDLCHSCGYVTLLNPLKEETHEDELDGDPFVAASNSSARKINASPPKSVPKDATPASASMQSDSDPTNGIKNQHCADVLASELDSLDQAAAGSSGNSATGKADLHLDVSAPELGGSAASSVPEESESVKTEEWMLLDLCYGLPLFDTQLNKQVFETFFIVWRQH